MHALRHWFASWCINPKEDVGLGLPPKIVKERMGHSTIALTMDRCSHLFPGTMIPTNWRRQSAPFSADCNITATW
jgi:integrase